MTTNWDVSSTTVKEATLGLGNLAIKTSDDGGSTLYRNVDLSNATEGNVVIYVHENDLNSADHIKLQACTSAGASCQDLGNLGTSTGKKTFSLNAALGAISVGRIQFIQNAEGQDDRFRSLALRFVPTRPSPSTRRRR